MHWVEADAKLAQVAVMGQVPGRTPPKPGGGCSRRVSGNDAGGTPPELVAGCL